MMDKCDSYHIQKKRWYTHNPITGEYIGHDIDVGVCWGTKETDECSCGGDRIQCDFYPEVRKKARKARESKFGEWISVEDTLPADKINCIVYYKHSYCDDDGYHAIGVSFYDGNEFQIGLAYRVTHWMPLPQPPNDKEEK